ncbi:acetyltransferase [Bifidobacterium cuniculi]|uniref:Acetyltransferase n=2 Tax=Bifidobacterium cuniculi TaxID=1688 RepID=A0A087AJN3_9BIFI|nr:acetyltransferase [Bifidobacterium cuniculi]
MRIIDYDGTYPDDVIALILHIQNDEAGIGLPLEEQPDLLDIPRAYIAPGGFWLAVDDDGALVGAIGLMNVGASCGILKKFFVRADRRAHGVDGALYRVLMAHCVRRAISTLILDTPSVAVDSHRFYERRGFVRADRLELPSAYGFPDRDSLLYLKRL